MASAPRRLTPTFYQHADYGPVCEIKTGPEAGADTVIEKVNTSHAQLFPEEYARFVQTYGLEKPAGTSLRKIPGVDDTLISILSIHGVTNAEQFAALNDVQAAALMPGASIRTVELRDVARLVVGKPVASQPSLIRDDPQVVALRLEMEQLRTEKAEAERDRDAALELATGGGIDEPEDEPGEDTSEDAITSPRRRGPNKPKG